MNTSLLSPPIEADERALYAFNEKELEIDPEDEIVSGKFGLHAETPEISSPIQILEDEEEIARREAEKLAKKQAKEQARKEKELEDLETASNSSAVSDNTCCTCREKFAEDDKSQACSGTKCKNTTSV